MEDEVIILIYSRLHQRIKEPSIAVHDLSERHPIAIGFKFPNETGLLDLNHPRPFSMRHPIAIGFEMHPPIGCNDYKNDPISTTTFLEGGLKCIGRSPLY